MVQYDAEKILDMKVEDGKRLWLIAWSGENSTTKKPWRPTWEPTKHVGQPLRDEYFSKAAQVRSCPRINFSIDAQPLEQLIPRKIGSIVMGDAPKPKANAAEGTDSFGHVHVTPRPGALHQGAGAARV